MNSISDGLILQRDIQALPLSDGFKRMAIMYGFANLDEILSFRLSFLLTREEFTPDVQQEFIVYLQEQGLGDLLKQY